MEIKELAKTLHALERKILPFLPKLNTQEQIIEASGLKEVEVSRALQWLSNKGVVELSEEKRQVIDLDKNGLVYLKDGLPEKRLLKVVSKGPVSLQQARNRAKLSKEEFSVALGALKKKAAIFVTKERDLVIKMMPQGERLLDRGMLEEQFLNKTFPFEAASLSDEEKLAFDTLKKRKDILKMDTQKTVTQKLTKLGIELINSNIAVGDFMDTLTASMLKDGSWQKKKFRAYDVKINVPKVRGGKKHFVQEAIEYVKSLWLDMGFEEMEGGFVQTGFWDLDALFVPQDHPARQMQDTYYLKDPKLGDIPKDIFGRVKKVHEDGGDTGSKGWQAPFSEEKAREILLRTHTTVLSARTLAKLKPEDLPKKFFCVNRVFRNEALDWKHLFEFHQVDGIVIDPNVNFQHLLGLLKRFFLKMGFKDVRIRPGHFPYTEPSAEIDVLHPKKNEWIELGGAGIFRPEVTKALFGKEIPVLAWGFGLERIILEYYDISDIRDLYKNDVKQLREMKSWMRFS